MKKLYIFILAANLYSAQNSDLLNTNWQVVKITGELFPDQFPPAMHYQQITQFNNDSPQLNLSFFNMVSANVTYSGQDSFTVNSKSCTLADYLDDNGEVNQFFGRLCNFFNNGSKYYYTIQNNGNEKTLVIGDLIFQGIYFKSVNLSVRDNEINKLNIYPNPATDYVIIENKNINSNIELFDSSGKLLKTIISKSSKQEVDIKSLIPGIYYLKKDGKLVQKIIKK